MYRINKSCYVSPLGGSRWCEAGWALGGVRQGLSSAFISPFWIQHFFIYDLSPFQVEASDLKPDEHVLVTDQACVQFLPKIPMHARLLTFDTCQVEATSSIPGEVPLVTDKVCLPNPSLSLSPSRLPGYDSWSHESTCSADGAGGQECLPMCVSVISIQECLPMCVSVISIDFPGNRKDAQWWCVWCGHEPGCPNPKLKILYNLYTLHLGGP